MFILFIQMINIDWVYTTSTYQWMRWEPDIDGNRFNTYICYGNRLLAKVYDLSEWDRDIWYMLYINKNDRFRQYRVYWYYSDTWLVWFTLWVLYNGERESNQSRDISNVPVQI